MTTELLVDGDILIYKTCWAVQTEVIWEDDIITMGLNCDEMYAQADLSIQKLIDKFTPDSVLICMSDKSSNNFRKKIYPEYKANRKNTAKPAGFYLLKKDLESKYSCVEYPTLEADDVMGILATTGGGTRIMVSIDKDMLTIPGTHYNWDTEELTEVDPETATYNHLFQTLVGDTTDNYPGCPGIGKVKAERILKSEGTTWDTVLKCYDGDEETALTMARLAYILQAHNYKDKEIIQWTPSVLVEN